MKNNKPIENYLDYYFKHLFKVTHVENDSKIVDSLELLHMYKKYNILTAINTNRSHIPDSFGLSTNILGYLVLHEETYCEP